ncbi:MAG: hypothetical protein P8009_03595 [Gammaproteobacteria bacterium]
MTKPYTPVPRFYHERLTIAMMCNESLPLHWEDADSGMSYYVTVYPNDIVTEDEMDFLLATTNEGEDVKIRLDMIRNMPTPTK